ncbi:ABC transporter substrate-binding protein [Nesterenkonia sphaerica]|uniref:Iron-siderophore ABC transporter substrate-binding protein n=1 Tax=Nesterenkonia sphaerica TaxID=1804988 RepID=A0A5R9AAD3_9MICC|nr:ABC transporter substrate-binding protein [Nesterenkonia sphaerica]TLP75739.1 iron-siderophore ABC transporter substrate-binding protein [Nesterenkonia sphaerica]
MNLALTLRSTAIAAGAAVFALTACGTTDVSEPEAGDPTANAGPVTVTDSRGEEITLDAPAERVVTLEWAQTENVEVLGGNHVGAADLDGFQTWTSAVDVDDEVTDVGMRTEPSLESIGQAAPDLILGDTSSVPEGLLEDLEEIAPVVLQEGADASDPLGTMEDNFYLTAELLGAQARADEVWAEFEATRDAGEEAIAEADVAGTPFVLVYPTVEGNTATFRMHGPGALAQTLGEEIGLESAWADEGDEAYAISQSDVEGLSSLHEDTIVYWWTSEDEPEDPLEPLEDNSAWNSLDFVENDAMHSMERIWIYGGPASAGQWIDYLSETAIETAGQQ